LNAAWRYPWLAGRSEENGYAERLMRTIKEEHVSLTEYRNMADAREQIALFTEDVYQRRRIYSSLRYLTPEEYEERWSKEHINKKD
jgi:transposase InsO family protein